MARRAESRKPRRLRPRLPAPTSLPCSRPSDASAAVLRRWRRPPRPTPGRRTPTTPSARIPPTGGSSPRGCVARACRRRRPPRKRSAFISPPRRTRRRRARGRHSRAAAVGNRLAVPPARPAARHPRSAYRDCAGRHPPPPRSPSSAKGRRLRRRASGHAGDAGHGPEGLA